MTPSRLILCAWLLAVSAISDGSSSAQASRVFRVGDDFGWRAPDANDTAIYSHWATTSRFNIGDSLWFVYQNDSVIEVDKWGYYHCNGSDPITAFDNGNSSVELDRPGAFYFISGVSSHCRRGQRLIVEVMHIHTYSPPTIADPPSYYSSIAPSPLSSTNSAASSSALCFPLPSVLLVLVSVFTILLFEP